MRLFVLHSSQASHWHSLNMIYPAVSEALRTLSIEVVWVDIRSESAATTLARAAPDDAIYVLAAETDLTVLLKKTSPQVKILLPIYGDMTIEFRRWVRYSKDLIGRRVKLLAASPRSRDQLACLVKEPDIVVVPYPVKPIFYPPSQERENGQVNLLYAGRLTAQKNILPLIAEVLRAQDLGADITLTLAGSFHDRGYHFHSTLVDMDKFRAEFFRLVERGGEGVRYLGMLSEAELAAQMQKASHVISMSTYHDEDYGLSVAQGMASGLIPILSDWGGHSFFSQACPFMAVPVIVDEYAVPQIDRGVLLKQLMVIGESIQQRDEIARWAREHISISAVAVQLLKAVEMDVREYQGQSDLFFDLVRAFEASNEIPFYHRREGFRELYQRVYGSYLGVSQSDSPQSPCT